MSVHIHEWPQATAIVPVLAAWHIDEGKFNNLNLGGMNVVGVFYSPGQHVHD